MSAATVFALAFMIVFVIGVGSHLARRERRQAEGIRHSCLTSRPGPITTTNAPRRRDDVSAALTDSTNPLHQVYYGGSDDSDCSSSD